MTTRVALFASVRLASAYISPDGFPSEEELVASVNANLSSTWRARVHRKFQGFNEMELRTFMGALPGVPSGASRAPIRNVSVPESFDSRTQWPGCEVSILDQGKCGSCWAFAAAEAASFRFCAAGGVSVELSPQELLSCANTLDLRCQGGQPGDAWLYMQSHGIQARACQPYADGAKTGSDAVLTPCSDSCSSAAVDATVYKVSDWYVVTDEMSGWDKNALKIMKEVAEHGPVEVTMSVMSDFLNYDSGVYYPGDGFPVGYHAVRLIGWGEDDTGVPYWSVANSWGADWGEKGYFRIYRGYGGDASITNSAVAGTPLIAGHVVV